MAKPCGNCAGYGKFLASKDTKIVEARKLVIGIDLAFGEDKSVEVFYKGGKVVDVREEKRG